MLYKVSLIFLILLLIVCLAISAADIIIQAKQIHRNLIVVIAFYVVLATLAIGFLWGRLVVVKSSLHRIPKPYMPIREQDVPKKIYDDIQNGFLETKSAKYLMQPRVEDIQSECWAPPGTPFFEGVNFKQAVARTPSIVEKVAVSKDPKYARPPFVPIRQYIEYLIDQGIVNEPLGKFYLDGYELARFSRIPITQEQYMDIMKYLAAILHNMGFNSNTDAHERDHKVEVISVTRSNISYDEEKIRLNIYKLMMTE